MVIKQWKGCKALKHISVRYWKIYLWFCVSTVVLLQGSIWYSTSFLELTVPSSSSLSFYQCTRGAEVFSSVAKTPISPAYVCCRNKMVLAPLPSLLAKDSLPATKQVARLCSCLLAGLKAQAAPSPSLKNDTRAVVYPQDTCLGCKRVRESFGAVDLLPFASAAPKMATQIPQTCSTHGRLIPTACLELKSRITWEEQKGLQLLLLLHPSQGGQVSPGSPVTTTELSSAQH